LTQARILVADDDAAIRKMVGGALHKAGYQVMFAEDAQSALGTFLMEGPDLLLLDIGLPDVDGRAVCTIIKSNDSTATIPVVAITGFSSPEDIAEGLLAGFDAYITKPFELDVLLRVVKEQLERVA